MDREVVQHTLADAADVDMSMIGGDIASHRRIIGIGLTVEVLGARAPRDLGHATHPEVETQGHCRCLGSISAPTKNQKVCFISNKCVSDRDRRFLKICRGWQLIFERTLFAVVDLHVSY